MQLAGAVEVVLDSQKLLDPFRWIEMPVCSVLAEMQFYGLRINRAYFPEMLVLLQDRLLLLQVRTLPLAATHRRVRGAPGGSPT